MGSWAKAISVQTPVELGEAKVQKCPTGYYLKPGVYLQPGGGVSSTLLEEACEKLGIDIRKPVSLRTVSLVGSKIRDLYFTDRWSG